MGLGSTTDLGALWDPEATRLAHVLVGIDRIEIVLCKPDEEWAQGGLQRVSASAQIAVVIAYLDPGARADCANPQDHDLMLYNDGLIVCARCRRRWVPEL